MKFEYIAPKDLKEIAKLKGEGGILFSGGTDLFVKMRLGAVRPKLLVDTKHIETPKMKCDDDLEIFMNTTYTDVLKEKCIEDWKLLKEILLEVGSPQIRNRGTPVGNIGNASPAGDFLLSAYIHNASVTIAPSMKEIPIKDLVKGPGKLNLAKDEFIYSIKLEKPNSLNKFFYEKIGRRNALVISIASIAVMALVEDGKVKDVRVAYGSLGPTIVRFEDLEEEMKGQKITDSFINHYAEKYQERIKPISDVRASADYRKALAKNLFIKAFSSFVS